MSHALLLSAAGAAMAAGTVAAYWAYTLLGVGAMAGFLRYGRRASLALAWLGAGAGLALAEPVTWIQWASLAAVGVLSIYALRNQWLLPRPAPQLSEGEWAPPPETLVAVLPDGRAVALSWLSRLRTARADDLLVVHCGLSHSLSAFEAPAGAVAARLPHRSGFEIGDGNQRWDGVDGSALGAHDSLHRVWIGLCRYDAWRRRHPRKPLLGLAGEGTPPPRHRHALVPGARGNSDGATLGRVENAAWQALADSELTRCPAPEDGAAPFYLARWAADERALSTT